MAIPPRFSFSFIDDNPPDKGCDNLERQLFNIGVEKLIKVLCNKGMVDPFDNVPVEVSGASRW